MVAATEANSRGDKKLAVYFYWFDFGAVPCHTGRREDVIENWLTLRYVEEARPILKCLHADRALRPRKSLCIFDGRVVQSENIA